MVQNSCTMTRFQNQLFGLLENLLLNLRKFKSRNCSNFQESLKDNNHLRRIPAHPVVDCVLHVAEPLLVVVDHVVIGHPARSPQLYNVQDLDTGDKLQLLVPRCCAEHGHEFVQLVLVESVKLHAALVEAAVEATQGREDNQAVVPIDQKQECYLNDLLKQH